jgi:DNA-binding response OmpR family regulator
MSVNPLIEAFNLSPAEGQAFAKLLGGNFVTREELHTAISNPGATLKVVDVTISKLRRKLAEHGIKIINRYKRGYRLDQNTRNLIAIGRTDDRERQQSQESA